MQGKAGELSNIFMSITTSLNIPGRMPVQAFHKVTHVNNNVGQAAKVEPGSK